MRRLSILFCLLAVVAARAFSRNRAISPGDSLWYRQPAANWYCAMPVGNGRLGAMVFGRPFHERYSLNESTLWSGGPRNWNNPGAKNYLPAIREAIGQGEYKKADSLSRYTQGPFTESYVAMADLYVDYPAGSDTAAENYRYGLDLDRATAFTRFSVGKTEYVRQVFASFHDQVIVVRDSARNGLISYRARLTSPLHFLRTEAVGTHTLRLRGKAPEHVDPKYLWKIPDSDAIRYAADTAGEGMNFEIDWSVTTEGGTVRIEGDQIVVTGARSATLLISAATSFRGFDKSPGLDGADPAPKARDLLAAAAKKSYGALLRRHLADYRPLYRRVAWTLGAPVRESRPTDERLKDDRGDDPGLAALFTQYGRYLLISASRGGQPANLKGIWNDLVRPEYSSNWCIDHDAQMFYYPAETNALPETQEPFLKLIGSLSATGAQTARVNYGMRGWVTHHNTDIWCESAPVGNYGAGNPAWADFNLSNAWLCNHLYEHFLFTRDTAFLRSAWPRMKGAAEFCLDYIGYDARDSVLLSPAVSPENTFIAGNGDTADISANTTLYLALVKELFRHNVRVAAILQTDRLFADTLAAVLKKIPAYRTGSSGQLLEWEKEWRPLDPSHRHLSHLYPVFPGNEINPRQQPALANAAKKALSLRAPTNSAWGYAWKAACWARLGEGDSAWALLVRQMQWVDPAFGDRRYQTGLFPNGFNSEGTSVILNGNECLAAAVTEMVLQSTESEIAILPALPRAFSEGKVTGLRTRNGYRVDCRWTRHRLAEARITSTGGRLCRLILPRAAKVFHRGEPVVVASESPGTISFVTAPGETYRIL